MIRLKLSYFWTYYTKTWLYGEVYNARTGERKMMTSKKMAGLKAEMVMPSKDLKDKVGHRLSWKKIYLANRLTLT